MAQHLSESAKRLRNTYPDLESLLDAVSKAGSLNKFALSMCVRLQTVQRYRDRLKREMVKAEIAPKMKPLVNKVLDKPIKPVESCGDTQVWKLDVEHYEKTGEVRKLEFLRTEKPQTWSAHLKGSHFVWKREESTCAK